MENIVNNFCETFGIEENQSRKRAEHHQQTESKNARIKTNWTTLRHGFSELDVTFEIQDSVHNIFTKKVLPTDVADRFLETKEIGLTKYEAFVKEKLEGEGSTWDTIQKEKIATFVSDNKAFTVTINNEIYQIKERKLLNRLFALLSNTSGLRNTTGEIRVFCDTFQYICIRWNIKPRKEKEWDSCAVAKSPAAKGGTRRHPNEWCKKSYFWCSGNC